MSRAKPVRAGYSGTPLATKLGIKPGARVALVEGPAGFERSLEGLPKDAAVARDPAGKGPFDVIVVFCSSRAALQKRFGACAARLAPAGGLWVAWPKKASGVPTDVTEDLIREHGLLVGLVDNKVCAIDAVWSGLRFVVRLRDRKG